MFDQANKQNIGDSEFGNLVVRWREQDIENEYCFPFERNTYTFQAKKIWTLFFLLHTKSSLEVQGRNHEKTSAMVNQSPCGYSNVPNTRVYTFISSKDCLLTLIEPKRQTLLEINVYAHLFGTLE